MSELRVLDDAEALARAAAEEVARCAEAAVRERGRFTIALSGGSTPRRLYRLLADREAPFFARIEWSATQVFWGDERHVPPDHADSNYRMAREALLDLVPVPPANIHRIQAELPDAAAAAEAYEIELRRAFSLTPGEAPRLDLVLLGLGADGHTASLFPNSDALHERARLAVAVWVARLSSFRITLTLPVFEHAAEVLFLVSGEDKAAVLQAVLEGAQREPEPYPAQLVRPREGRLLWLADRTAASRLE